MGFFSRLAGRVSASQKEDATVLVAPVSGEVVTLESTGDPAFSSRAMGDGVAIVPDSKTNALPVLAPVSGTVAALFPTGHAFAIMADDGATQAVVHIGIDTVKMAGEGFCARVSQGDRVAAGQPVVDVDLQKVELAGCEPTTFVTVCERAEGTSLREHAVGPVSAGDELLRIV